MAVFVCRVCGYHYDEDEGDEESGVPPKTEFYDLPWMWKCPNCGAFKEDFEELAEEEQEEESYFP